VESKRQQLILKNQISITGLKKAVTEVKDAEKRLLSELLPEDQSLIETDFHVFEADINAKTRKNLSKVLPELGILLAYEYEDR
jgi:hypothetical protein